MISESGGMPGVGAIHKSEIEPTLKKLERALGIDLINNTLGSVFKKEFSGDIDVAVDLGEEDLPDFEKKLQTVPEIEKISKSSVIMTKTKIENFNPMLQGNAARTGYVQIDFMPGDPAWLKTFYHAPRETESQYKGVFRNLLLSSIVAFLPQEHSEETTEDGRPLETIRWIWSSKSGLAKVKTKPVPAKSGKGYTKKHKNIPVESHKDPQKIVELLNLDSVDDLDSYETLKSALDKNWKKSTVKKILKDFASNPIVQSVGVPAELQEAVTDGTTDWFRCMIETVKSTT